MKKTNKNVNVLIRRNLLSILNNKGIKRVNSKALLLIEAHIKHELEMLASSLKEEIFIKGRKTLKKEDVKDAIEKIQKREEAFEI